LTKESFAAGAESQPDAADGAQPAAAGGESAQAGALTISLPLGAILRTLPPMQLIGDVDEVASDARLELPFSTVEPQLVTGRVTLKPEEFAAALPEAYRGFFDATSAAPVSLPLQEVLKNLPSASLRMRDDQEEQEKGANFATPFSAKAEEDAKRFKTSGAPVPKPMVLPPAPQPVADAAPEPIAFQFADPLAAVAPLKISQPTPAISFAAANGQRNALQTALDTNEELDAKSVVTHVGRMPGVEACAIIFGDGLSLAGNLPESYHADALCAVAPSVLQRLGNHMADTKLGALRAMTLSCAEAAITFFMPDNLCLAVLHPGAELTADVRERLASVVQELSRIYSHPA
jgi:predicted regulator of Ras-like GTPase activity (Roadblock/LC7/MglB family)